VSYAAAQDMIDRYGQVEMIQLTDRVDPPAGLVDMALIDRELDDASSLADSYLKARYTLPLATVPGMLKTRVCEIARYKLHVITPTEKVKYDYEAALRFFKDVAAGTAQIPGLDGVEPVSNGAGEVAFSTGERLLTRNSMRGL
jgi:phage gp36-like protein